MRPNSSPQMHVVRKEEKEAKLRAFIQKHIAGLEPATPGAPRAEYHLVMRSFDSPIARALAGLSNELATEGISLQVVIVQFQAAETAGFERITSASCKSVSDTRYLDAHEQLILDGHTAWVGDCMRREPAKRDAYECYCEDSAEVAEFARRSFDRFWTAAQPTNMRKHSLKRPAMTVRDVIDPALAALAGPEQSQVRPTTRH